MANEKLIKQHIEKWGCTREEAIQLITDDDAIDKGEKLFELDPELAKGAKKARQADRKVSTSATKRVREAKPEKAHICEAMMNGLRHYCVVEEFDITNAEREFLFVLDGTKYKVTLACPRK
jgi:hypothetical protein